jgi:hypothetical protein
MPMVVRSACDLCNVRAHFDYGHENGKIDTDYLYSVYFESLVYQDFSPFTDSWGKPEHRPYTSLSF